MLTIRHLLNGGQFSPSGLLEIFQLAERLRKRDGLGLLKKPLKSRQVFLAFEEPSTRTRLSFEIAIRKLGGNPVIIDNLEKKSSLAKGESFEDMLRTLAAFGIKIVIIRHPEVNLPSRLAQISDYHRLGISIINAGDGNNEHPVQSFLDVYTVWREKREKLEKGELTVAYIGDLKDSRVAHSGIQAFSNFGVKIILLPALEATSDILKYAPKIDVWNLLRFQKERKKGRSNLDRLEETYYQCCTLTKEIRKLAKPDALFLHSRPRGREIPLEVDNDPRQRYVINFDFSDPWQNQETNGLYLKMALLCLIAESA